MDGPLTLPQPETTGADYFDLAAAQNARAAGEVLHFPPFELAHWGGLTFCLNYHNDPIQRALRAGTFYEADVLAEVLRHLPQGAHILDVGANIGNHALFFATRAKAARVVVIEPNPLAMAPLFANVVVNGLDGVIDLDYLGIGLSDEDAGGFAMHRHDRNLGATKMRKGGGDLQVRRGDDLFGDQVFHFVKIDTEGMEIKVLSGISKLVDRCQPTILVEVFHGHIPALMNWMDTHRYQPVADWPVATDTSNYLLQPLG
ncbi:FkbM family methyltransferase [Ketogulonicigenium vulgare]|uniref:FkbM family methyltransferase n=1 Tax=Ketogulonicigenium vulgare TaxID=92945 RepID=UPI0023588205|nr:FkbM family methyltransferase [Ketogulonicigenium vulgare]